ncbi:MAG: FlgD immunoglobulin-like domain containing protein [Candidatus Eisenbacteria bacterium]
MVRESFAPRETGTPFRRALRQTVGPLVGIALLLMGALPAQAINCLTQEMRMRLPENAAELAMQPRTHQPGHPMAPPENPQVGDSWNWYLWYFAGGPPHAVSTQCTVRGLGDNVYVIVDDNAWNVIVDQADVDQIVANFDNTSYGNWPTKGIFQLNTEAFGDPPDVIDNDPRIYLVLYDWDVTGADGYWNQGDELPDSAGNPSNECECLYVDASTTAPGGPSGAYLTAVMAHEFEHMIHWNGDPNEVPWVDEGLAELAMWFYGNPDAVTSFPANPDRNLTVFSTYADYIKTYLWSLYLYEHFGGTPTIRALVANPGTSLVGVQSTLQQMGYTETVDEVVRDWATANYLDDPTVGGGKFNYEGEDLPPFAAITQSAYPVSPVNATLNHWAGEYVRFINGEPQLLQFDGGATTTWHVRAVRYSSGSPVSVEDMVLDGDAIGNVYLSGFGTEYDEVVMVVVDASNIGTLSYVYSTEDATTSVDDGLASGGLRLLDGGPNPFRDAATLTLDLERAARVEATIHDVTGRQVRTLAYSPMEAGAHVLRWDGRDDQGSPVANGVYLLQVVTDRGSGLRHRLIRVR